MAQVLRSQLSVLVCIFYCYIFSRVLGFTPFRNSPPTTHNRFKGLPSLLRENEDKKRLVTGQNKLLVDLWTHIAFPDENTPEIAFKLADYGLKRGDVKGFIQHFQNCKDCAADKAFLMATQNEEKEDILRLSSVFFPIFSEEEDDEEWGMFDRSLLGEEGNEEEEGSNTNGDIVSTDSDDAIPALIFPIETDDSIVLRDSKQWVQSIIADFGVCPFTVNPDRAGIPQGGVRYTISRATNIDEAFLRYWDEIQILLTAPEKEISTVLLVFPELELFGDYELFEAYCECLSDSLCASSMGFESEIQLVFFHPKYQFRDGQARTGESQGAANFARRSPWPMINLLRTNQVRAAQKGIPTGIVYKQNEERLAAVGAPTLTRMLYHRDWEGLPVHHAAKLVKMSAEDSTVSTNPEEKCPMTSQEKEIAIAAKCPVDHGAQLVNDMRAEHDEGQQGEVTSPLSSSSDGGATVEDYLKFADDIEKWLQQESNVDSAANRD